MDYEDFCHEILRLEPGVRFAGIADANGEIRFGGERVGITRLFTSEETKRSILQAIDRWKLRDNLAHKIGICPIDETHLLLVSTEPSTDHGKIIESILRLKLLLK